MNLVIPPQYGYVILSEVGVLFLNYILGGFVGSARKKYQVPYPHMYTNEESKQAFNWIQRGHQNALEFLPQVMVLGSVVGLFYPLTATAGIVTWAVGRIGFMKGYAESPEKRYSYGGWLHHIGQLILVGGGVAAAYTLLTSPSY